MVGRLKEHWRKFKGSAPGRRFQDSYHRRQSGQGGFSVKRIFNIVLGSVLVVGSIFFGWAPGPGMVTLLLGLVLIAGELVIVARLLDLAEVRLRKLARLALRLWTKASATG